MRSVLGLVAVAFAVGIAVGDRLGVPLLWGIGLAAAGAMLVGAARWAERGIGVAATLLAVLLGVLAASGARPRPPPGLLDETPWTVEAEVARTPERSLGMTRLLAEVHALEREGRRRAASGRVRVVIEGDPYEPLLPGDPVRFTARLRAPRGFRNPGGVDSARRAAAEGVVAVAGVHTPAALVRLLGPVHGGVLRLLARARLAMLAQIAARLTGQERALVSALVLGDRGDVSPAVDDDFRAAGVSHVLSVSGLHLAIAAFLFYAGLTWVLLRVPGLGRGVPVRRLAAAAALPATVAYTLLTGAQVATVRACVVAFVCLGGVVADRRVSFGDALAVAALAILADSPLELFDVSFELSIAAALGTALLGSRWAPRGQGKSLLARLGRWMGALCATSLAATVTTAPITACVFAQLSVGGVVSNLLVVPLAELAVVPIGLGGCALAALGCWPGGLLIQLAGGCAWAMAAIAHLFAAWAPSWRVPAPSWLEIVVWYVGWSTIPLGLRRSGKIALCCALAAVALMGARLAATRFSSTLSATFLDVGQGDACVLELGHGHVAVVDGGGSIDPGFDPGALVIAPYLWKQGVRRIDLIVLSHPHPDHANGLATLVEQFPVGEVWTNGAETTQPGTLRLLAEAARRHVRIGAPRPVVIGGTRIVPLYPLDGQGRVTVDPALGDNDDSLVVQVEHARRRLLFAGDIEREGEARLLSAQPRVQADVVKVPHHGSRTSSSAPFVAGVRPRIAVISVGEHNRWGFPNPAVLARYAAARVRVLRTDLDGAVRVSVSAGGKITVATWQAGLR